MGVAPVQIGAATIARRHVLKLLDKYGFEKTTKCIRQMNESAEIRYDAGNTVRDPGDELGGCRTRQWLTSSV